MTPWGLLIPGSQDPVLAQSYLKWNVKVTRSCPTLWPHGLNSPGNSPGQNTGVGSHSFLQEIFPIQGSNPGLPHCKWILYYLSHQWSPKPGQYLPVATPRAQKCQHHFQKECGLTEALQRQMRLPLAGVGWRGLQRHICLAQVQGPDYDIKAHQLCQPAQRTLNEPSSDLEQNRLAPSPENQPPKRWMHVFITHKTEQITW